jgi:hypothetical protein
MVHWLRKLTLACVVLTALFASSLITAPALAQEDPEQLRDLATAYECELALGSAAPLGPQAVLVAMATLPCVETLANGAVQGYALVQCVLQYPAGVCLGLE